VTSRSTIKPWLLFELEELYLGYKVAFCARTKEEVEAYIKTHKNPSLFRNELWIANVVEGTLEVVGR